MYTNMKKKSIKPLILLLLIISEAISAFPLTVVKTGEWDCGDCRKMYGYDIAVKGDYVYIAGGEAGIFVIDVSQSASPKGVARYGSGGNIVSLHLEGQNLYAADTEKGLLVVDIANVPLLRPAGCCPWCDGINDISIEGDHAVLGTIASGLKIVDISRPCHSIEQGGYDPGALTCFSRAIVRDGIVYSICGCEEHFELTLVDVSNPAMPVLLGTSQLDYPRSFALSGDYVFVGESSNLTVFDVTSPSSPTLATTCNVHGFVNDLSIEGDTLYAAADDLGLLVINIKDAENPVIEGVYNTPGRATAVCAQDNTIYMTGGQGGKLYVFQLKNE